MRKKKHNYILILIIIATFVLTSKGSSKELERNVGTNFDTISVSNLAQSGNCIYASVLEVGIMKSSNYGEDWLLSSEGLDTSLCLLVVAKDDFIVAWDIYGVFYTSNNAGLNWELDSFFVNNNLDGIWALIYDNTIIVSSLNGMYMKSINYNSWISVSYFENKYCFIIAEHNGKIYVSTDDGLIYGDLNDNSWNHMNNRGVNSMTFFDNKIQITNDSGIFFTTNNGLKWENITYNINVPKDPYDGTLELYSLNDKLYLTSIEGIYYLVESEKQWHKCSMKTLPENFRSNWTMTAIDNIILAGSQSVGVFKSTDGINFYPSNKGIPKVVY